MNIPTAVTEFLAPARSKRVSASVLSLAFLLAMWPPSLRAQDQQQAPPPAQDAPAADQQAAPPAQDATGQAPAAAAPAYTQQTPEQLQQLVAPIALYPDSLVAQILAAATFPEQVVEADRWLQANPGVKDDALAQAVDQKTWDPSVKALTAFPSVLGNMDKNLSWTSSLGDAYYNQQQDVMDAVQVMRQKAQATGNLKSTDQQTVTSNDSTIQIAPANPQIVYVPAYDPWLVYGYPIVAWPGWYPYPGIWFGGPYLSFGVGFGIGFYGGYGWGWNNWGFDWRNHYTIYNNTRYISHSTVFYNRDAYYRGGVARGVVGARPGAVRPGEVRPGEVRPGEARPGEVRPGEARPGEVTHGDVHPFGGDRQAARGYAAPSSGSNSRPNAFGGVERGGETRSYSSRGSASFGGGGGGFHGGGGGGSHGGGGRH
jgi:uncharacterized membrane protein YgcG